KFSPTKIDYVDVYLVADKEGIPSLASAFNPRHPEPTSATPNTTTIAVGDIGIQRVWVHGGLPTLPIIDLDLLNLAGQFSSAPSGMRAEISLGRLVARSTPVALNPEGSLRARINIPASSPDRMVGSAQFKGTVAHAPTTLDAFLDGRKIEARLQAPEVPPSVIQERIPNSKLQGPSSVELNIQGELPHLNLTASIKSPAAHAEVTAEATLEQTTTVATKLALSEFDLGAWLGTAPRTRLSATVATTVVVAPDGAISGEYRVELPRGSFGNNETPAASTTGKLRRTHGATTIEGSLDLSDPGVSANSQYQFELPARGSPVLQTRVVARFDDPARLRELTDVRASGTLKARAELKIEPRLLSATASIHLSPFSHPSAELRSVDAVITATGPLTAPELNLRLDARQGSLAGNPVSNLRIQAEGDTSQLRVHGLLESDQRRLRIETRLAMNEGLTLDQPSLEFSEQAGPVFVKANRVRVLPQRMEVSDLTIDGLGQVRASGSLRGKTVDARFETQDLNLARVSRLLNTRLFDHGLLTISGQLKGTAGDLVGQVKGRATELARDGFRGGQAEFDLAFADRRVDGSILAELGNSHLKARVSDVDLPKPPFTRERMNAIRGTISLDGDLNLRQLAPALAAAGVPIEQASGQIAIELRAQHLRASDEPPTILLHARSNGLKLVEQRRDADRVDTPTEAKRTKPRALEGIDADIRLNLEPAQGRAQLGVGVFDRRGSILTLVGESTLPASAAGMVPRELERLPVRIALRIPERAIEALPISIRPTSMQGQLAAALDAEGTLEQPRLRAQLALKKFFPRGGKHFIDVQADAQYDADGGKLAVKAVSMRGGSADLQTSWKGNLLRRVREQEADQSFFELQSDLGFERFPLGVVPALFERQIRGPLSGWIKLRGFGSDAVLQAQLDGSGLVVNRIRQPQLQATVLANDQELRVALDARQEPGTAHVEIKTKNRWGARLLPEVDPHATLRLVADRFQLEALGPLLLRYLSTIEGELDADVLAQLDPEQPKVEGKARLRKGVVQMPQIGQRLSDIRADVAIGNNEIRVNELQARGVTGRLTGEAKARLRGAELKDLSAQIDIREQEKLPVTLEGVEIGEAWGHVALAYANSGEQTEINVEVPNLHLLTPEAAQNSVQDLAPPEDIRVGTHRADGKFVAIPLQPLEGKAAEEETPSSTKIRVRLGDSVWVEKGHQLRVQLGGELAIESGATRKVAGRIEVKSGKLDVSGKRFDLERGVVTFDPESDPSNPTVTATARWDSPSGYVVYADYVGTAKDGKLKLHSEPVLTQDEVLSLLLFGSPEGNIASSGSGGTSGGLGSSASSPGNRGSAANASSGSGSPNAAGAAVSIAGSTATKGLNRALSDVTSLDVSTRIDTSTGSSRPELVVQLTPRLTTRLTRAIGEPAPGQSLDRTFLTLELRLKRAWSASAVIGDKGASRVDLIWRKRY
ncbi:MAG TPA: translocation/assembly module TamB domain-containing protein, partial [Polyangiaceae bacterium]|nr:translocation/assembly module TamB domain-containing protein [Polyangiaceae bacterium]